MVEVHVVASNNRDLYEAELDSYFEWRHRVYVGEKGWHAPFPDGRERDQFDTARATYLLGFENGDLVTGSRLLPTDAPHLLSEVFSHLGEVKCIPRRPDVAEWTRMLVVPSRRERGHSGVAGQMCCAVMEYLLEEGASQVGGVQELYWLPRWQDYGWRVHPLGLPDEIGGVWCLAAYFDVSEEALAGVRAATGVARPLLVRKGAPDPFVPRPKVPPPRPGLDLQGGIEQID